MNRLEYLAALRRALTGLPPEAAARTMAYYEQRFVDGAAAGQSDAEISATLDEPRKIALTLRASTHLSSFEQKKTPLSLVRMLVSSIGLLIFNLFMVVPAIVYASLLVALYATALGCYIGGIAITASGLAGANELVLQGPLKEWASDWNADRDPSMQTRITISNHGINLHREARDESNGDNKPEVKVELKAEVKDDDSAVASTTDDEDGEARPEVWRKAESLAGQGLHISTDMDQHSRTTQVLLGIGILLCGIAMFLAGLVVTKYTLIGIRRYLDMNFSLLRGS
jgi:uncharacterized membrane protein